MVAGGYQPRWLRLDWPTVVQGSTWAGLQAQLAQTKRNYFRFGISLDGALRHAVLEGELNGAAVLYGGDEVEHAVLNQDAFQRLAKRRFKLDDVDFSADAPIWIFGTEGAFLDLEGGDAHLLDGPGLSAGRRRFKVLSVADVRQLIVRGSRYLAAQVQPSGQFHYGWRPCFDRPIDTYNNLRHASSLYALIEAYETTADASLVEPIERARRYLVEDIIREVLLPSGVPAAFLVDLGEEVKLGGNAVAILALVKYAQVFKRDVDGERLRRLGEGVLFLQDTKTGRFNHVIHFPSLATKEAFRIIYYDGEAAFALMRLFAHNHDPRLLAAVESAFGYFIANEHWRAHDHWLGYCVNELTRHRPRREYFEFGVRNVADYLDFVANRITTFPTLLELMMAAEEMITRLRVSQEHQELLARLDLGAFYTAMHKRAHHMLNGHFWPELAMYFERPDRIEGSFFIRHHGFRVRIDDVEHYLSGYVAYLKFQQRMAEALRVAAELKTVASAREATTS